MGRKHCGKKKLLVTSNFSISHSVFKGLVSQERQKVSLCGNGLRKLFLLFSQCFLPYMALIFHFYMHFKMSSAICLN